MKKHPLIQIDFQSTVKLSPSDEKKISKWLKMGSESIEQLITSGKIINRAWLKNTSTIRVSVMLCGEAKIKKLNSSYRQKNKVTDVLSFPNYGSLRVAPTQDDFLSDDLFLGDLAICHQRTASQAEEFNISYWDEFIHLFTHGMIHLMGFDHEVSPKEEKLMEKWENEALTRFSKIKKKGP